VLCKLIVIRKCITFGVFESLSVNMLANQAGLNRDIYWQNGFTDCLEVVFNVNCARCNVKCFKAPSIEWLIKLY